MNTLENLEESLSNKLINFYNKSKNTNLFITPKQGGSNKSAWAYTEKLLINELVKYEKIEFKKEFWCIVTARRNSKSIKRKNLVKIKGKELIKYSFDVIKKSTKLKKQLLQLTMKK